MAVGFKTYGHEDKFWNLWPMPSSGEDDSAITIDHAPSGITIHAEQQTSTAEHIPLANSSKLICTSPMQLEEHELSELMGRTLRSTENLSSNICKNASIHPFNELQAQMSTQEWLKRQTS